MFICVDQAAIITEGIRATARVTFPGWSTFRLFRVKHGKKNVKNLLSVTVKSVRGSELR